MNYKDFAELIDSKKFDPATSTVWICDLKNRINPLDSYIRNIPPTEVWTFSNKDPQYKPKQRYLQGDYHFRGLKKVGGGPTSISIAPYDKDWRGLDVFFAEAECVARYIEMIEQTDIEMDEALEEAKRKIAKRKKQLGVDRIKMAKRLIGI